ncbi:hypothetical protein Pmani_027851 [Petrolisthes manimaculis]|uniref:Uncharacterized protein n=1 Tax=Petrolisthes manimaculis TaxID=1843537 RepID=A0AAE1TW32_9EUCA|nr:hypothetical protein Pmani_027851 [Petrolisthes manimaculis]
MCLLCPRLQRTELTFPGWCLAFPLGIAVNLTFDLCGGGVEDTVRYTAAVANRTRGSECDSLSLQLHHMQWDTLFNFPDKISDGHKEEYGLRSGSDVCGVRMVSWAIVGRNACELD